ncbi:MAG: Hsp20/alpha crystallin family protein [Saprospiraceae bacterium]|uniref:Hsp20/alpha crystallin family protein n=1 Tax=Candidatus Opimibacter skivensis TaxID=2982028 RepID=A0A9D7SUE6_9BACT|nr:Hsp20/alpha crystallin family protein [Candidatus Opimibacter skivensis]
MKPYACYPGARARFQPMHSNVRSPYNFNVPFTSGKETRPAANIVRNEGSFEIQLAVPGFAKDQIKIEVNEDQLIVTATNPNQDDQKLKFIRQEFEALSFKRVFRLHRNANSSALKASFDQGILTIIIPDKEPETIKIAIQ